MLLRTHLRTQAPAGNGLSSGQQNARTLGRVPKSRGDGRSAPLPPTSLSADLHVCVTLTHIIFMH